VLRLRIPDYSDECQFLELQRGGTTGFAIDANGYIRSNAGGNFEGTVIANAFNTEGCVYAIGSQETQGDFQSSSTASGTKVLSGISTAGATWDRIGVYGEATEADFCGYGVVGRGGYDGVLGQVISTGGYEYNGVEGEAFGGTGTNIGMKGSAGYGATNYGVYGTASGTGTKYASYFEGDVNVTGTLYGGVPAFRIDHPLDPENRYLVHSSVESDEMMNIYNGNVVLDSRGEASVEMPDWFEALNQDFRYQLTAIGVPGPNLYIAEEIAGGRFAIAGGEPGSKVSWMVTGVRRDPAAVANRVAVEVDKPASEVGKYMHPKAYGMPVTAGVGYLEDRELP